VAFAPSHAPLLLYCRPLHPPLPLPLPPPRSLHKSILTLARLTLTHSFTRHLPPTTTHSGVLTAHQRPAHTYVHTAGKGSPRPPLKRTTRAFQFHSDALDPSVLFRPTARGHRREQHRLHRGDSRRWDVGTGDSAAHYRRAVTSTPRHPLLFCTTRLSTATHPFTD
jgi:hypothetical protein